MSDRETRFLQQQVAYLTEELSASRANNERLRAALRPFTAPLLKNEQFLDDLPDSKPIDGTPFVLGDFRAAKALLEGE